MSIEALARRARACRLCYEAPQVQPPLPQPPRPVFQVGAGARICIASQAPGNLAHIHGRPFYDPSGRRLRSWLGVDEATFYDPHCFAIVPMGFCFPGTDARGGDLPPRPECAPTWREAFFRELTDLRLVLVIGQYAQRWHLGSRWRGNLTRTVADWRAILEEDARPRVLPLPHPSWRNNAWLRRNPWFEVELLPVLRREVAELLAEQES